MRRLPTLPFHFLAPGWLGGAGAPNRRVFLGGTPGLGGGAAPGLGGGTAGLTGRAGTEAEVGLADWVGLAAAEAVTGRLGPAWPGLTTGLTGRAAAAGLAAEAGLG